MRQLQISPEILSTLETRRMKIGRTEGGFIVDSQGKVTYIRFIRGFYLRCIVFEDKTVARGSGDIPSPDETETFIVDPKRCGFTAINFAPEGTVLTR